MEHFVVVANLFHYNQFVWCTIKQCIESVTFASHANIIILRRQLLLESSAITQIKEIIISTGLICQEIDRTQNTY